LKGSTPYVKFKINSGSKKTSDSSSSSSEIHCGCVECNDEVWKTQAAEHTCGERIEFLQSLGLAESDACSAIAGIQGEYPDICGSACDPERCTPEIPPPCGCRTCTNEVWNTVANGHTCGARIDWLSNRDRPGFYTEEEACAQVGGMEFPDPCGPCDPAQCNSEQVESSIEDSQCSSHSRCAHLEGDCCPAPDGTMLACCNDRPEESVPPVPETPAPVPKQSAPEPPAPEQPTPEPPVPEPGPPVPKPPGSGQPEPEPIVPIPKPPVPVPEQPVPVPEQPAPGPPAPEQPVPEQPVLVPVPEPPVPELPVPEPPVPVPEQPAPEPPAPEPPAPIPVPVPVPEPPIPKPPGSGQLAPGPTEEHHHIPVSDLGPNTVIFDPSIPVTTIQEVFDRVWHNQVNNEMGTERYAFYFLPGTYGTPQNPLHLKLGYYMDVAGLGSNPDMVQINGKVEVYNRCFMADEYQDGLFVPGSPEQGAVCFALNNFWRSLSNLVINVVSIPGEDQCRSSANFWAISQASSMRRVDVRGARLSLMDYCTEPGFASGGYMADTRVGAVINGGQQQWYTRNSEIADWQAAVWNLVFTGVTGGFTPNEDSAGVYPDPPFTKIDRTPISREKPYLFVEEDEYYVRVPWARTQTAGITWANGQLTQGITLLITDFFIATPNHSVGMINAALSQGKHLIFTPGVYDIDESIHVQNANTVVLGLGIATLTAVNGAIPLKIADKEGIIVSGVTIDAGTVLSKVLLQVGEPGSDVQIDPHNPITLHDIYFRIGGPHIGKTDIALEVNSDYVLIDHTWIWRADHGIENFDKTDGFDGDNERWRTNIGNYGIVVNGDHVTATGLFVEHFQKHNTLWNGEGGRVYFYQNELPYEPSTQEEWMTPDGTKGWAGYKVSDLVRDHELIGGGVYCYNRNNPSVETENGFEAPVTPGVKLMHIMTRNLSGPGIVNNVINGNGGQVDTDNRGPNYVI